MSRDNFLKGVIVLDTETTNLYADKAEIVEIASATYDGHNWNVNSMLLGAKDGIPPEASAKNHISNRMIAGLPTFAETVDKVTDLLRWNCADDLMYVAHNSKYDQIALATAFRTCADHWHHYAEEVAMNPCKWICTFRLARQLLNDSFDDMQYNLSYLRYKLDLPIEDDVSVHRAAGDTLTCAVLFEFLVDYALATDKVIEGPDLGTQIFELCWSPIIKTKWPFGKHKGALLTAIPTDYYMWAINNMDILNEDKSDYDSDLAESVKRVLEKRLD